MCDTPIAATANPGANGETSDDLSVRLRTQAAQPRDHVVGLASLRHVERCQIVPADPVDIGATLDEELGDAAMTAMTRAPQRRGDVVGGCRIATK